VPTTTSTSSTSTSSSTTSSTTSTTTPAGGERCTDGIDNDGDDLFDCVDPDCATDPACQGGCAVQPTFPSITCRFGALIARIEATANIQVEQARLVFYLTRSRQCEMDGLTTCAGGDTRGARKRLQQSAKRLQQYLHRLRSGSARRAIPAQLRAELSDAGDAIRSDVKTLRAALECPADATGP